MKESDYFTNICPQNKEMNNGVRHHFKAFLVSDDDGYHTIAFLCPNNPDSVTTAGTAQSVNAVESFTGYDFFEFLDDAVEETIEEEIPPVPIVTCGMVRRVRGQKGEIFSGDAPII